MAEGVGFEPTEAFTSHAFQACRFGRSRTLPSDDISTIAGWSGYLPCTLDTSTTSGSLVGGEVAVGSCATIARKPGQVLTEAASTRERLCAADRLAVTSLSMSNTRIAERVVHVEEQMVQAGPSHRWSSVAACHHAGELLQRSRRS